jgi:hypothetical protein
VAVEGRQAYLAMGLLGVYVIDITNPRSPQVIASVDTPGQARGLTAQANHLYVADYTGLAVVDIADPRRPQVVGHLATAGHYAVAAAVHEHYAYLALNSGLAVVDISAPSSPRQLGWANVERSMSWFRPVEIAIAGRHAYVAASADGLAVFDLTDGARPRQVGQLPARRVDSAIYTVNSVAVRGRHAFITDDDCLLRSIDVSDPAVPREVDRLQLPTSCFGPLLAGPDGMLYVPGGGLTVIGTTRAGRMATVGTSDPGPMVTKGIVADGLAYLWGSDSLSVFDLSDPSRPALRGRLVRTGISPADAEVSSGHLFVADYDVGLRVIDVRDARNPRLVGSLRTPGGAKGVAVAGSRAYIADPQAGLVAADVSMPSRPVLLGSAPTPGEACGVEVDGSHAYVTFLDRAVATTGIAVVDVRAPTDPRLTAIWPWRSVLLDVSAGYAYLAGHGFRVLDVADAANPRLVGYIPGRDRYAVSVWGDYAFIWSVWNAPHPRRVVAIDVCDATQPRQAGFVDLREGPAWLAVMGDTLLVATWWGYGPTG